MKKIIVLFFSCISLVYPALAESERHVEKGGLFLDKGEDVEVIESVVEEVKIEESGKMRFFVGANVLSSYTIWDPDFKYESSEYLAHIPNNHLGVGAEIGFESSPFEVAGIGATVAYDYLFDSDAVVDYKYVKNVGDEIQLGMSAISMTLDMYLNNLSNIKKNKVGGVIFGAGLARANERVKILGQTFDFDGTAMVLKLGYRAYNFENNISAVGALRYFMSLESGADRKGVFALNFGLRYMF